MVGRERKALGLITAARGLARLTREELPILVGVATLAAFRFGADQMLDGLNDPLLAGLLFAWLFVAMLWTAFGVVRHAEALARLLGEPYGTLILTMAVTGIEVSLIASVMLTGEASPTLARDTMKAVLMIVLNLLVGSALLLGGWRHREQDFNLAGARAFLVVLIPLAVFALVMPNFTVTTSEPTFSQSQAGFIALVTVLLYGVFLAIQTARHRSYFVQPWRESTTKQQAMPHTRGPIRSSAFHGVMLPLTMLPIVLLSKDLAQLVDFGIVRAEAPAALGGILIALLVLTPEGIAAMNAARANALQRSVNILLGSALATIGLTVPAALAISLIIGQPIVLGLDDASMVILMTTFLVSMITFGDGRTNILHGAVHLVLFLAYIMLIFKP